MKSLTFEGELKCLIPLTFFPPCSVITKVLKKGWIFMGENFCIRDGRQVWMYYYATLNCLFYRLNSLVLWTFS